MQDWQKKLVGQQYRDGVFYNILDSGIEKAKVFAKGKVKNYFDGLKVSIKNPKVIENKKIYGKEFKAPKRSGVLKKWGYVYAVDLVEKMALNYLDNKWQAAKGSAVASDLDAVTPDYELISKLHNETGYTFDYDRFMKEFKGELSASDPIARYNEDWRKIMPDILKSAFAKEMNTMLSTMTSNANAGSMMYNKSAYEANLRNAVDIFGKLFEKMGEQIAVKTDVLDIPPRFQADAKLDKDEMPKKGELSEKEQKIWNERKVSRPGLTTQKDIDKSIETAVKGYVEPSCDEMFNNFSKKLFRALDNGEMYNPLNDKALDLVRIHQATYTMRALNRRIIEHDGAYAEKHPEEVKKEKETLQKMKDIIVGTYNFGSKKLDGMIDLKMDKLYNTSSLIAKTAGIIPYPPAPTTTEQLIEGTRYYGKKVVDITWDATKKITSSTLNVVAKGSGYLIDLTKRIGGNIYSLVKNPEEDARTARSELSGDEWEVMSKKSAPTMSESHMSTPEGRELEAAPEGNLEEWQRKIIGRKSIGLRGLGEDLVDKVRVYTKAEYKKFYQGFVKSREDYGKLKAKSIYGKTYTEGEAGFSSTLLTFGLSKVVPFFADTAVYDMIDGKYKKSTGAAVANDISACEPDYNLITDMYNATGYKFDSKKFMEDFKNHVSEIPGSQYNKNWKTEIMPELLKLAFDKEMKNMMNSIAEQANNCNTMSNRELTRDNMMLAAQMLGGVFEDFSKQIANKTDYLEIPHRMIADPTKEKEILPRDKGQTIEERKRWNEKKVVRPGLTTKKEVNAVVDNAMKAIKIREPKQMLEDFQKNMFAFHDGEPYTIGSSLDVDETRKMQALLSMRELKSQIDSAGTLTKLFSSGKLKEQKRVLEEMKSTFSTVFSVPADEIEKNLDLKMKIADPYNNRHLIGLPLEYKKTSLERYADSLKETISGIKDAVTEYADSAAVQVENFIEGFMDWVDGPAETEESLIKKKEEARKQMQEADAHADVEIVDGEVFVEANEKEPEADADADEDEFEDAASDEKELNENIESEKKKELAKEKELSDKIDKKIFECTGEYMNNLKNQMNECDSDGDELTADECATKLLAGKQYLMFIKKSVMSSKDADPMHSPNLPLDTLLGEKLLDRMIEHNMGTQGFKEAMKTIPKEELYSKASLEFNDTKLAHFHMKVTEPQKAEVQTVKQAPQKVIVNEKKNEGKALG